jgi:hypothetical protein
VSRGRNRNLTATAAVALALLGALAFASSASACSCAPLTSKTVKKADAAAVMELESVDGTGGGSYEEGSGKADFTYTVRKVYSGRRLESGDSVTITSSTSSAACGLDDRKGRKYGMVLKRGKNGKWTSNACWQTTPKRLKGLAKGADKRSSGCR